MKGGQLIENYEINIFFKINAENEDFFLIFERILHEVKSDGTQLTFNIFR